MSGTHRDRLETVVAGMSDSDYAKERDRLRSSFAGTLDPVVGSALGWLLWNRYRAAPEKADGAEVQEAVQAFAICLTADAGEIPEELLPQVADAAAPYAAGLLERALDTLDPDAAGLAAELWNRIANILPDRAGYLSRLGVALRVQFERSGNLDRLDLAVRAGELAIARSAPDDPDRPSYLCNFGITLGIRYIHGGNSSDLADSVAFLREAADTLPAAHPERAAYLSALAAALRRSYADGGAASALDEAVLRASEANLLAGPDPPEKTRLLSHLSITMLTRYGQSGNLADLSGAVDARAGLLASFRRGIPAHPR